MKLHLVCLSLIFVCCSAMLKDFFNTSSEGYIYFKKDVVNYLKQCLPSFNVSEWEESVRTENMTEKTCSLTSKIKENCAYEGKMNSSVEYYKLLLSDSDSLCFHEFRWFHGLCNVIIIVCVVLIFILVLEQILLKFYLKYNSVCRNCRGADTLYLIKYCKENVPDDNVSRDTVN